MNKLLMMMMIPVEVPPVLLKKTWRSDCWCTADLGWLILAKCKNVEKTIITDH